MRPLLLLVPALAWAVDLPAPRLDVHPDGARLVWNLDLPAGEHRIELPDTSGAAVAVRGADAWSLRSEPGSQPPVPPALAALLPERHRLVARAAALAAAEQALLAAELRLRARLPRQAAISADTPAWQAGLDAVLAERTRLDEERQALAESRARLAAAARAAAGAAGEAVLDLRGDRPLTSAGLAEAWAARLGAAPERLHLLVQLAHPGCIAIDAWREDCRWRSSADLRLAGGVAMLARQVIIDKPAGLALGRMAVRACAAPLQPAIAAPAPPVVSLIAQPVADALRKLVQTGTREVAWTEMPPLPAAAKAVTRTAASEDRKDEGLSIGASGGGAGLFGKRSAGRVEEPAAPFPAGAAVTPGALVIDLGTQELPAGQDRLTVAAGTAELAIAADEWALLPEERPVAVHRLSVRLDGRPLPAGTLRVASAGELPVATELPWTPGGAVLTVCAGIDERITVCTTSPWQVWPGDNDARRRRAGTDHWLLNTAPEARTVAVYRTMPVSTLDEVEVLRDPASTPGDTAVVPGLRRWEVALPPGVPTRIGLGWTLQASGSFRFE